MPKVLLNIVAACMNSIYRHQCRRHRRRPLALFLSRQTDKPSYDYQELAAQVEKAGWETVMLVRKIRPRNLPTYCIHVLQQLKLMAQASTVVIDRYDPVISLINLKCETPPETSPAHATDKLPMHTEFPTTPVVVQLWHAFGAYKHFGYQSIDTLEGHSTSFFDTWRIHRNCSWIVCSGQAARSAYARAFNVPTDRVICAARPEYFELVSLRAERNKELCTTRPTVLFAPTLRYNTASPHPLRNLAARQQEVEAALDAHTQWSFHPLESNQDAPGNVSQLLMDADIVVTDYSSLVFEAYLLGTPTLFYVEDIDLFRLSPGLNIDPTQACPALCAHTLDELAALVTRVHTKDGHMWALRQLEAFADGMFMEDPDPNALAKLIVNRTPV